MLQLKVKLGTAPSSSLHHEDADAEDSPAVSPPVSEASSIPSTQRRRKSGESADNALLSGLDNRSSQMMEMQPQQPQQQQQHHHHQMSFTSQLLASVAMRAPTSRPASCPPDVPPSHHGLITMTPMPSPSTQMVLQLHPLSA